MKRWFVVLFLLGVSTGLWSQGQGNIWYFGEGLGLDFNGANPAPLEDGQIFGNPQSMGEALRSEGSATISDASGSLLFYSDGEQIWNRDHELMPNGTGLEGMYSSTHAAFIVPRPLSDSIFYVFTTDGLERRLEGGLRYSVVDMCLNQGLGDVVVGQKNILVLDSVAEKLSAVNHVNGKDIWLIAHKMFSNAFYAYQISELGIVNTVVSEVGSVHVGVLSFLDGAGGAIGQMKTSASGRRLALLVGNRSPNFSELFDFDPATGVVSNPISIDTENLAYGIEFSPDNSKLYINSLSGLHQFDLSAGTGTPADINGSKTQIRSGGCLPAGMQLGPDGRIYVSRCNNTLGVIRRPNRAGTACDYRNSGVQFSSSRTTGASFPSFISNFEYRNGLFGCAVPTEDDPLACSDGLDNDGDGLIDCLDDDCADIFPDGCATCFNDGLSFADSVLAYNPTCPGNTNTNPQAALGVADFAATGQDVSLGEGGSLVLAFTNNIVVNSGTPDPDIWIFEVGPQIEPSSVELRPANGITEARLLGVGLADADGDGFFEFGNIAGATAALDLDAVATGFAFAELKFDAIKIVDLADRPCSGNTPGADIDAVCALSSITCTTVSFASEAIQICAGESYEGYTATGTYRDTLLTDAGCDSIRVLDLEVSDLAVFSLDVRPVACGTAGSIQVLAGNGIGILRYSIDGTNFQTSNFFPNLGAGSYLVTVQDANACQVTAPATVGGSDGPSIDQTQVDPTTCGADNGQIVATATGGVPPLSYRLSGGAEQATGNFPDLPAGDYLLQVSDADGCDASVALTVGAKTPPQIRRLETLPPNCGADNGQVRILATGSAPLAYSLDGLTYQSVDSFSNLGAGTYSAFVRDGDDCVVQDEVTLLAGLAPEILSIEVGPASCGLANGQVVIEATGGVGTLLYAIEDRNYRAEPIFTDLAGGEYLLVIEDEAACEVERVFTVESLPNLTLAAVEVAAANCGESDGRLVLDLAGGALPYRYVLNGGSPSLDPELDQLAAGAYTLQVSDANDCVVATDFSIPSGECELYLPNVFSPNGDGVNDWFGLYVKEGVLLRVLELQVFDRWGGLVYQNEDFIVEDAGRRQSWDGTQNGRLLQPGIYVYTLRAQWENGTVEEWRGDVLVAY
ncbi:MAG: gliding motility-associated C-terminal domain-containing protein [Bacteroidota bacterium]